MRTFTMMKMRIFSRERRGSGRGRKPLLKRRVISAWQRNFLGLMELFDHVQWEKEVGHFKMVKKEVEKKKLDRELDQTRKGKEFWG